MEKPKILEFVKVASSEGIASNDANDKYFVPADKILMLQASDANTLKIHLKAVAGTTNDTVGDNITITATGLAESYGDEIANLLYGNMSSKYGGAVPVIDKDFFTGKISALTLTAV
tara:strand:- start:807 stop:1154 length:348 start_codon:yes stop_codon:yes gene_type:complete